jgi:subtilase family serine protease
MEYITNMDSFIENEQFNSNNLGENSRIKKQILIYFCSIVLIFIILIYVTITIMRIIK